MSTVSPLLLGADSFDPAKVTPGVTGFLVVVLLAVALVLLLRSMTRHLGRIKFEEEPLDGQAPVDPVPPADPGSRPT